MKKKMTMTDYHAHPAVGSSSLRTLIDRSPAHFLYERENPSEPTPAQIQGDFIHAATLEPERFTKTLIIEPIFEGKTKKGEITTNPNCAEVREAREKWYVENHDKLIVSRDQRDMITGILANISKHPVASKLIAAGAAEESYFWKNPETGIECKCRPDFLRENHIVVDVKSTIDASYASFQKTIANFGYHIQAAFYLDGVSAVLGKKFDDFTIVAVEKDPPFAINVFRLDETAINEGRASYQGALMLLKHCQDSGKWPAYSDEITPIDLPTWAYKGER